MSTEKPSPEKAQTVKKAPAPTKAEEQIMEKEIGGFEHMAEPTRFGDWEVNGRCYDF